MRGHAKNYDLDPSLLAAVIYTESRFNARARSEAGAIGLMQLLPDTARGIAVRTGGDAFVVDDLYVAGDQRPLRRVVSPQPPQPLRRRAHRARRLPRGPGQRRQLAQAGRRHPVPGDAELRREGRAGEADLRRLVREGARAALACRRMADPRDRTYAELIVDDCLEVAAGLAGARRRQPAGPAAARGAVRGDRAARRATRSCASRSRASCRSRSAGSRRRRWSSSRSRRRSSATRSRTADALIFVSAPDNTRAAAAIDDRADGHPAGRLPA